MQLRLVVREGIRQDEEFTIKGNVSIGRTNADLSLKDPKSSTVHAKITLLGSGEFELTDLKSLNGTFVNHNRISSCILKKGDVILIGKTILEVIDIGNPTLFEQGSWQETLDSVLITVQQFYEKLPHKKSDFKPFSRPINLQTIKGIKDYPVFTFSYGPRSFGPPSIETSFVGQLYFELISDDNKNCTLVSKTENLSVNGTVTQTKVLEDNDLISVGQIELIVKF